MKALQLKILRELEKGTLDLATLAERIGAESSGVASTLEALSHRRLVKLHRGLDERLSLNEEGLRYAELGLPEARLVKALPLGRQLPLEKAIELSRLSKDEAPIAIAWARQKQLIELLHKDKRSFIKCRSKSIELSDAIDLLKRSKTLSANRLPPQAVKELKRRRLVNVETQRTLSAELTTSGKAALKRAVSEITELTPQLLASGEWRTARFAPYDLQTAIAPITVGKKHFYKQLLSRVREALISLGFREVRGPLLELEFWNCDALFMPQDHLARDIHDIFYVDTRPLKLPSAALVERVRWAHETGWRTPWEVARATSPIMRSQTTAVSARELAKAPRAPVKLFTIGKCFRPDRIDWCHFIEFHQCEGIIAAPNVTLRDLMGCLQEITKEIFGAQATCFQPSYFPFTEPSLEILVRIPGKGDWLEVGGAGLLRPEVLECLGVATPVLAWGLGIDRLAMLKGLTDIRHIHSSDLELLKAL